MKNRFKNRQSATSNSSTGGEDNDKVSRGSGVVDGNVDNQCNDLNDSQNEISLDLPIPRKSSQDLLPSYQQVSSRY